MSNSVPANLTPQALEKLKADIAKKSKESRGLKIDSLDDIKNQKVEGFEILGVCVDCSGSMADGFPGHNNRRDAAQAAMSTLYDATDFSVCELKVYCFDNNVTVIEVDFDKSPTISMPNGGTNFQLPLAECLKEGCTRIILASDGESSFPEQEVRMCRGQGIKIDCIFIGSPGGSGEETLRRIADQTGGIFTLVEDTESLVTTFEMLESRNRLLLEHDPNASSKPNPPNVIKL